MCLIIQAEDWRFGGWASTFGRAEQHSGDKTRETQPSGKHHHILSQMLSAMDLLISHKGTNFINSMAAAQPVWDCRLIYTKAFHIWVFQTQLDQGSLQCPVEKLVNSLVLDCTYLNAISWWLWSFTKKLNRSGSVINMANCWIVVTGY